MTELEKQEIKYNNESLIEKRGFRFNPWLPMIEEPHIRTLDDIKGRMAVMNALINISFEAPIPVIKDWLEQYDLSKYLSNWEKEILEKTNKELSHRETNTLRWYLEALWAFMWATAMIDELDERKWCGDNMVELLPNLEQNEDNAKLEAITTLKPAKELYKMLDYYYRLHWYCVDERINGHEVKNTNEGLIYERRKALEWLLNTENNWDDIEMGT
ncbi:MULTISPECIES: DUF4272 domain-containing protein [Chitinophagaceae]